MVARPDESDGTFLKLPCDYAKVTNIDGSGHLDHFEYYEAVRAAFFILHREHSVSTVSR